MVSEQKVRIMTKMAIFDKHEGDRCRKVVEYRRRDYVAICGLGQFFLGTLMFAIGFAVYFFVKLKDVIFAMRLSDIKELGIKVAAYYLVFTLVYQLFVRIRARVYYNRCMRKVKEFEDSFTKLNHIYKEEEEYTAPLEYIEHEEIH